MQKEQLKIGLLIHDIDSDYSRQIINGVSQFCFSNNINLFIFPVRAKKWPYGAFDYQYQCMVNHISEKSLDGIIIATATQSHYISKDELYSFIESFNPLPKISIGRSEERRVGKEC